MTIYMPPSGDEDTIFGRGMNVVTGQPVGAVCVTGFTTTGEPSEIGTDNTNYVLVEDSSSYNDLLSTTATMSGSGLCWSASASMSYLRQQTGSDTSISLVWLRMIQSQARYADMSQANISDDALTLLKTQGVSAFVTQYGTHCAIGVAYGGSFIGRFRIDTASASDKESIAASVKGSISDFGMNGSVSADFQQQLQSQSTSYQATLQANATGSGIVPYSTFDLAGVEAALGGFKLQHDGGRNVDGAAFAFVCQTWDQFPQIAEALSAMGQPNALQFTAEQATLNALAAEFAALDYIQNTCKALLSAGSYAVPSYQPLLLTMASTAASYQAQIVSLSMDAVSRLTAQGLGPYIVSPKMMPLLETIGHGDVMLKVSWALDGAFSGDINDTLNLPYQPNSGDQQVIDLDHSRPEGDDPPQNMALFVNVASDGSGNATLNTRMHWHDPYGPPNDADYLGNPVQLTGFPVGTSTASWTSFPWNQMSATLAGLDPSIQVAAPPTLAAPESAAELISIVAEPVH